MKKILSILFALVLVFSLAACSSNNSTTTTATTEVSTVAVPTVGEDHEEHDHAHYADGIYFATDDDFNPENGWKGTVTVEVKDEHIVRVDWNAANVNAGKDKKTASKDGEYNMVKFGKAQSEWHEQAEKVEAYVIEHNEFDVTYDDGGHTDAIAGVSVHVNDFKELFDKAMAQGPVGMGKYADGAYRAEVSEPKGDWKDSVDVTVINGYIVSINWTATNKEGVDKKQSSIDGSYGMVEKGKAQSEWHEQVKLVEEAVINSQDVDSITVNEEGRPDALTGVSIKIGTFKDLLKEALK